MLTPLELIQDSLLGAAKPKRVKVEQRTTLGIKQVLNENITSIERARSAKLVCASSAASVHHLLQMWTIFNVYVPSSTSVHHLQHLCTICIIASRIEHALASAYEQIGKNVEKIETRTVTSTLFLNNPYDAGDWGSIGLCPDQSFVHAIEVLFYPPGAVDETAINAVKLYCSTEDKVDTGYVISASGPDGDWYGMRVCTTPFVTGFRGKVLEYQGLFTDDVAVQDFEAECNFGIEVLPGISNNKDEKFNEGEWSVWSQCPPGNAVCGLQTRVEAPQIADDDTAVTDVNLFCCPRSSSNSTQ
ncbi:Vitelline membrane outer layer protein I (VOMI) [Trinorchestia longiramus]|nr:Vitelline membrane outer layer protein I (VOMI) [Trinorchestia longiramus]